MVEEKDKAEFLTIAVDALNSSSFKDICYNPRDHTYSMSMIILHWEFFLQNNMVMDFFTTRSRIAIFSGIIEKNSLLVNLEISERELFRGIQIPICEGLEGTVSIGCLIKESILSAGKKE